MAKRITSHLRGNVVAYIALFIALGGTAYALQDNSVRSRHVVNESLTGRDIKNQSGVDSCSHGTDRYGQLCALGPNEQHTWDNAATLCSSIELRLPTVGEARTLAMKHDVPGVAPGGGGFWTDNYFHNYTTSFGNREFVTVVFESGEIFFSNLGTELDTVCVTTPTN